MSKKQALILVACFQLLTIFDAFAETKILASGRDHDVIAEIEKSALIIDNLMDELGISRPKHQLEFVPSTELAHLAALGGPARGHWYDGSVIVTQSRNSMGVLEFVVPGPTCRSFYSDASSLSEQREILKHVAGHNSFGMNSLYSTVRQPSNSIEAAEELYHYMEKVYVEQEFDEVAQWYQYLLSFAYAQDLARGTFQVPKDFIQSEKDMKNGIHPKSPVPHEIQFLVENLPAGTPHWKKHMAMLYEQVVRGYGDVVPTKIMNEGWATFLQEFLTPHLPWQSDQEVLEYAHLRSGVAYPKLSNPYWLGREAWRRLYARFKEAHKGEGLSLFELDREFVKYAQDLIEQYDDYAFLRKALDEAWVRKHKLFIHRAARLEEYDQSLPPPKKPNQEQKIVVSTRAKDVIDMVAKRVGDKELQIPRIFLENISATDRQVYSLVHEVIDDIPLVGKSAAQSLYIRSQIWKRTVSLKTIASSTWLKKKNNARFFGPHFPGPRQKSIELFPIRIEVLPSGKTAVYQREDSGEILHDELTEIFQLYVSHFQEELKGSIHSELEKAQEKSFNALMEVELGQATEASQASVSHAPSSAVAVLRYMEMLKRRMADAVRRAVRDATVKKTARGVRIQVLPSIPSFDLDQNIRHILEKTRLSAALDDVVVPKHSNRSTMADLMRNDQSGRLVLNKKSLALDVMMAADIGAGEHNPSEGDSFWGDRDPEGGAGEGSGDEPSEGTEGDPDPSEMDISLELFGKIIAEEIELPNLRPKPGMTECKDIEKDGSKKRDHGEFLWTKISAKAYGYGAAMAKHQGLDFRTMPMGDLVKRGLVCLPKSHYLVPDHEPVPSPDMNAVVVIWMDMTGSMMGDPIKMAKEFMFYLKSLLSTKYKNIEFRYVGFADRAEEYKTEKEFFSSFLNGGTDYTSGIGMTEKILKSYSNDHYDKFSFGIGDAEDSNGAKSSALLARMIKETQYSAFIRTDNGHNHPDATFMGGVQSLASSQKAFFGYAELQTLGESGLDAIRKLLGKNRAK